MHSVQEVFVMKIELLPVEEMPLQEPEVIVAVVGRHSVPLVGQGAKAGHSQPPASNQRYLSSQPSVSADVGAQDDLFAGGPSDPRPLVLERGCFYFAAIWPIPSTSSKGVTDVRTIIILSGTNA